MFQFPTLLATCLTFVMFLFCSVQVQDKLHEELDRVVAGSVVTSQHRPSLPYTEATLTEIFRCGPTAPIALTRSCRINTKIGDHLVTAGTTIHSNLYTVTRDPKLWGQDVEEFKPERFLIENGTKFKNNDAWDLHFSTGNCTHSLYILFALFCFVLFCFVLIK
jgi:cytochrome P450